MRISKYNNIFSKVYSRNVLEAVFLLKKLKILFREPMQEKTLMVNKLLELSMKNNCKKQVKQNSESEK